jgi:hypothetical protein
MWHGFPVFLIGVTDMRRKFHPISLSICCGEETSDYEFIFCVLKEIILKLFGVIYEPHILVADGALAITNAFVNVFKNQSIVRIMCWVHMQRNADKHLNSNDLKEFKDDILKDISVLQKCISTKHFQYACDLFFLKWQSKNNVSLNSFLDYFKNEWVLSSNNCWYEGACDRVPKQNNGLESNNLVIKTHHTLRSRLSLSHYLNNAESMLKNWSIDRTKSDLKFQTIIEIDFHWPLAYTWIKENGMMFRYLNAPGVCFIVTKQKYQHLITNFMNFLSAENLNFDFDSLNNIVSHVFVVTMDEKVWMNSKCTCYYYQKKYFCIHIICVAVNLNLVKIPPHCKNMVQIGEKPKRGRIPNAKNVCDILSNLRAAVHLVLLNSIFSTHI